MQLKVLKVYLQICKLGKQKPSSLELNQFEKELREEPDILKRINKRLEELGC